MSEDWNKPLTTNIGCGGERIEVPLIRYTIGFREPVMDIDVEHAARLAKFFAKAANQPGQDPRDTLRDTLKGAPRAPKPRREEMDRPSWDDSCSGGAVTSGSSVRSAAQEVIEALDTHKFAGAEFPPEVNLEFWDTISTMARANANAIREEQGWV